MKLCNILGVGIILCATAFTASAQKILDKPWIKENTPTRRVVPYTHVREADVMWHRRIWRTIDLREKINHPLYFPLDPIEDRKSLYEVIKNAIMEGTITAYDQMDDEFTVPLTKAQARDQMGRVSVEEARDEYGDLIPGAIADSNYEEYGSVDIIAYRLKEDWFFDNERSIMDVRIMGICPIRDNIDPETGESKGKAPMFWIYFPEARYVFANWDVFNRHNEAEKRTFEDIFWKRMFSSYVYKRSNVYDRNNRSYLKGIDLLLEADKIKEDIFNMEHDLWHF